MTRKINIRLPENDLIALQRKAATEGIPYQTLTGSILHKLDNYDKYDVEIAAGLLAKES